MTVVDTRSGPVEGTVCDNVHEFLGIPYAGPISGLRRWAAPVRESRWSGTRRATVYGPSDRQGSMGLGRADELLGPVPAAGDEALTLNVWTPQPASSGNLPVIVFIHGGGFVMGSGTFAGYRGASLARLGAVVVTINYRLGYPGWLPLAAHFPDTAIVDNRGLLDQIASLEWVQECIGAFGGDTGRVLIAGESAGGVSVAALLAAPQAASLFHCAVAMSPTFTPFGPEADNRMVGAEFLLRSGVKPGDTNGLATLDPDAVLTTQSGLELDVALSILDGRFGAASQRSIGLTVATGVDTLPVHPETALATGSAREKAILAGWAAEEWRTYTRGGSAPVGQLVDAIGIRAICGGETVADDVAETYADLPERERTEAIMTDGAFRWPAVRLLEAHRAGSGTAYAYRFDWPAPGLDGALGAGHITDLPFWFSTLDTDFGRAIGGDDPPLGLAASMSKALVSMAATSKPAAPGLPSWPTYEADRPTVLLDEKSSVALDPGRPLDTWFRTL